MDVINFGVLSWLAGCSARLRRMSVTMWKEFCQFRSVSKFMFFFCRILMCRWRLNGCQLQCRLIQMAPIDCYASSRRRPSLAPTHLYGTYFNRFHSTFSFHSRASCTCEKWQKSSKSFAYIFARRTVFCHYFIAFSTASSLSILNHFDAFGQKVRIRCHTHAAKFMYCKSVCRSLYLKSEP